MAAFNRVRGCLGNIFYVMVIGSGTSSNYPSLEENVSDKEGTLIDPKTGEPRILETVDGIQGTLRRVEVQEEGQTKPTPETCFLPLPSKGPGM